MRATRLEVNIDHFLENAERIKNYSHKKIMPVIKANAYGTYLNHRIDVLNNFDIVAVALVDEGINLRKENYQGEIFVLNQPSIDEIDLIIENNLTIGISEPTFIEACIKKEASFPVHIEIETGMNRTGIRLSELNKIISLLKNSKLKIEGIYSHFSSADNDPEYTDKQLRTFEEALALCKRLDVSFKYIHISASNGLINYEIPYTNLVRPGLILYGYEPFEGSYDTLPLKPVCTLKTNITFLKKLPVGAAISYSQKYHTTKETLVATIPIGYGDGYRRALSNKGYVYINGKQAPVIGNICMDSCMIDVTGIDCQLGDEVIIFDDNVTLDEIAKTCNTINYEILCTISERVPRIFIGENNE